MKAPTFLSSVTRAAPYRALLAVYSRELRCDNMCVDKVMRIGHKTTSTGVTWVTFPRVTRTSPAPNAAAVPRETRIQLVAIWLSLFRLLPAQYSLVSEDLWPLFSRPRRMPNLGLQKSSTTKRDSKSIAPHPAQSHAYTNLTMQMMSSYIQPTRRRKNFAAFPILSLGVHTVSRCICATVPTCVS